MFSLLRDLFSRGKKDIVKVNDGIKKNWMGNAWEDYDMSNNVFDETWKDMDYRDYVNMKSKTFQGLSSWDVRNFLTEQSRFNCQIHHILRQLGKGVYHESNKIR